MTSRAKLELNWDTEAAKRLNVFHLPLSEWLTEWDSSATANEKLKAAKEKTNKKKNKTLTLIKLFCKCFPFMVERIAPDRMVLCETLKKMLQMSFWQKNHNKKLHMHMGLWKENISPQFKEAIHGAKWTWIASDIDLALTWLYELRWCLITR